MIAHRALLVRVEEIICKDCEMERVSEKTSIDNYARDKHKLAVDEPCANKSGGTFGSRQWHIEDSTLEIR
ncbi:hypothetical protein WSM22_23190 [Cytophagales bacterium WSM2-2]|nr:hypothetical protein WSM22_23190 [Cytophagales bacterium WSM2-2]